MKVFLIILGLIAVALGLVWLLQGLNIWPGSAMSGHKKWALVGGGLVLVGIVIEFLALRMKKA
jgi:hypothetical protein